MTTTGVGPGADDEYLAKRQLRSGAAGWVLLAALGAAEEALT